MPQVTYRGIPEHGLRFVAPGETGYSELVSDILSRPQPFPTWPVDDLSDAAVLLNQSGKAVIGISYLWRYHRADGPPVTHGGSNLGSSMQLDVLTGRATVGEDLGTFILPGSKRLITRQGMFGNNLDVLGNLPRGGGGGFAGSGSRRTGWDNAPATHIDLTLDAAIFEDGLCVGPDERNLFGQLREDLAGQAQLASQIVDKLRGGAPLGQIFEIVRPLAQRSRLAPPSSAGFLHMFASSAIHRLTYGTEDEILAWFEQEATTSADRLHRP